MKILLYFSGNLYDAKGTPIRVRNILGILVKQGLEVYYVGYQKPEELTDSHFLKIGKTYCRPFQIARFVKEHDIGKIYIQTSAGLWLAPFLKFLTSTSIGVDFHSLKIEEDRIYQGMGACRYFFLRNFEKALASFLDFATGVSEPLMEYYKNNVPKHKVIPGGVDISLFNPHIHGNVDLLSWKQDSVLIGYAGNLKWYQGVHTVLRAFARVTVSHPGTFRLLVIASSADASINSFILENNLGPYVKILSSKKHELIPSLLITADILTIVRPSNKITEYAFPSKFPEHAALGKALIVSRVGDVPSYVNAFRAGIVIEPENVDQLYQALLQLADSRKREVLGTNAWELVRRQLDIDIIGKKLTNFLLQNDSDGKR